MENVPVIEIRELSKKYGQNLAIDNISFAVNQGEIVGFLGPNGAGKSTTMNVLTGYISATSGDALVCGIDIAADPKGAKSKIGYLPEQPPLYVDMTVLEYLNFVYDLKKVKMGRVEHISSIVEMIKIDDVKNRLIRNLSKGYRQRVGIAAALLGDPQVLILDEPTVGLDPQQILEMRNVIKEAGKNRAIILSTHILQEVNAVCDRIIIINKGKIVIDDTTQNIKDMAQQNDSSLEEVFISLINKQTLDEMTQVAEEIEKTVNTDTVEEVENNESNI